MTDPLESEIQNRIFLEFGRLPDLKLFRNNTGVARSEVTTRAHLERLFGWLTTARNENQLKAQTANAVGLIRSLLGEQPRFTPFGLCKGSSDIIGICQRIARDGNGDISVRRGPGVFIAWEIKRPGRKPTDEQQMFLDTVNQMGGVGDCIHSVEEARRSYERAKGGW